MSEYNNYKQKYLKYKNKYINLKNIKGGTLTEEQLVELKNIDVLYDIKKRIGIRRYLSFSNITNHTYKSDEVEESVKNDYLYILLKKLEIVEEPFFNYTDGYDGFWVAYLTEPGKREIELLTGIKSYETQEREEEERKAILMSKCLTNAAYERFAFHDDDEYYE